MQDNADGASLPEALATMCSSLLVGGQRCAGIEYIQDQNMAFFLTTSTSTGWLYPTLSGADGEICNSPHATQWIVNSGNAAQCILSNAK